MAPSSAQNRSFESDDFFISVLIIKRFIINNNNAITLRHTPVQVPISKTEIITGIGDYAFELFIYLLSCSVQIVRSF